MADENEMNKKIMIEGSEATLADLAGLSLDDVKEKRGEALPKGCFDFEISSEPPPHLAVSGEGDKAKGAAQFKFKVLDVVALSDDDYKGTKDELISKDHFERFFLSDGDSLGYLKAFLVDLGASSAGKPLKDLLQDCAGLRVRAFIGKRKDKNDSDIVYTNIVRGKGKIVSLAKAAESSVAGAVAA